MDKSMTTPIYTIVVLKAKPGRLEDLKTALEALAIETRKEPGCLSYTYIQDTNHDAHTLVSYEKWESIEAEAAHWQTPHMQATLAQAGDILDAAPVIHRGPQII